MLYPTLFGSLLTDNCLGYHLYADDTQLFTSFDFSTFYLAIKLFASISGNIKSCMACNKLLLNPSKASFHQLTSSANFIGSHQFLWMGDGFLIVLDVFTDWR